MFIVIICFAAILVSMAVVARQGSRFVESVQQDINMRNEIMRQRVNR